MLKDHEDAFGHEIYDHHKAIGGSEIIERDDATFKSQVDQTRASPDMKTGRRISRKQ